MSEYLCYVAVTLAVCGILVGLLVIGALISAKPTQQRTFEKLQARGGEGTELGIELYQRTLDFYQTQGPEERPSPLAQDSLATQPIPLMPPLPRHFATQQLALEGGTAPTYTPSHAAA